MVEARDSSFLEATHEPLSLFLSASLSFPFFSRAVGLLASSVFLLEDPVEVARQRVIAREQQSSKKPSKRKAGQRR